MNKIKLLIATLFAVTLSLVPAVPVVAQSATEDPLCAGAALDATQIGNTGNCQTNNEGAAENVNGLVKMIIDIFSWVVGVVSVLMIIVGGFKYITSGGDANGVTGAKNTIMYAIVGLVIVALAQLIVKFVLGNVTNLSS